MENEANLQQSLFTTDDAAAYLRLSPRTLEHWREVGIGPAFIKLGRSVRYTGSAIDAYLSESNFRNTAEASKTSRFLRGQPSAAIQKTRKRNYGA